MQNQTRQMMNSAKAGIIEGQQMAYSISPDQVVGGHGVEFICRS